MSIYFVYGLAFFLMGFAVLGECIRSERTWLVTSLFFLALYGLLHALVEWAEMLEVVAAAEPGWATAFATVHRVLLPISLIPLQVFGIRLMWPALGRPKALALVPVALVAAWLLVGMLPLVRAVPGVTSTAAWQEAWARYLLYMPGSLLAAIALLVQRQLFLSAKMPTIAWHATLAAAAFAFNAIFAGLLVPSAPFAPAYWLNYPNVSEWLGFPPQLLRALAAIVVAYGVVQMLRFSDLAERRRLERLRQQRFQAQQEALRLQEEARRRAEEWSRTLEKAVEERTRQLDALATINTQISALLDLDRVLDGVVEKARQLLGVDLVSLSLLDTTTGDLAMRAVSGARTQGFRSLRLPPGYGVAGRAVQQGHPIVHEGCSQNGTPPEQMPALLAQEGLGSCMAVPLRIGERTLGALFAAARDDRHFDAQAVELLSRFAQQAAIALENALLYTQVQEMAAIQERERLAREVHDSLAQALGFLRLLLGKAREAVQRGQPAVAVEALGRMDRAAEAAYADARDAILGLRTNVLADREFVPVLQDYLHTFSLQHGIRAHLDVEAGVAYHLTPAMEVQAIRIIQEALTNVRKHAQASSVQVTFRRQESGVFICIQDNGQGFDPSAEARREGPHFGLVSMRERAESVRGRLEIESAPGKGTRISLWLPSVENGVRIGP